MASSHKKVSQTPLVVLGVVLLLSLSSLPALASDHRGTLSRQDPALMDGVLVPAFDTDLPLGQVTYGQQVPVGTSAPTGQCSIYTSDPWHTTNRINGEGSQACSGAFLWQSLSVEIQQCRSFGFWATKKTVSKSQQPVSFIDLFPYWRCGAGSGNQLYRIVSIGSFKDMELTVYSAAVVSLN